MKFFFAKNIPEHIVSSELFPKISKHSWLMVYASQKWKIMYHQGQTKIGKSTVS